MFRTRRVITTLILVALTVTTLASQCRAASTKILVVDGNAAFRQIVRNLLNQNGYTDIEEAADGTSALQKLRKNKFGLVISNLNMEPMTGLQLLKEIRADAKLTGTPFLVVTANPKSAEVYEAKAAGANDYIQKPFNAGKLKEKIDSVLGN
ncbi:MAG: response regulator [Vulcanimicrobiota bacterium]